LTDTDKQSESEHTIPNWKADKEFQRWSQKSQEITQQLMESESQERFIHEEIRATEDKVTQIKSEILLGEGSDTDLQQAEASVQNLLQRNINNVQEIKALKLAKTKAEKETSRTEAEARERCMAKVLPLYQQKVKALMNHLNAAAEANEAIKEFEALVGQSGLSLHRGSFGSRYVLNGLHFPGGLKDYAKSVEALLNKETL
jgi:hypothetical protein